MANKKKQPVKKKQSVLSKAMKFNLINLLGKIKRENVGFSGYSENPRLFDYLGEKGISVRDVEDKSLILKLLAPAPRSHVLGNTIFVKDAETIGERTTDWHERYYRNLERREGFWPGSTRAIGEHKKPFSSLMMEEIPHVQQFRERGLIGMLGKSLLDLAQVGFQQKKLYDVKESYEGFHHEDPVEKLRLQREILPGYEGVV
tara:strand:+ start:638 stop:1243 length:606 start_codon:yes stop_codon:yes gene_type:complete